MYVGRSLDFSPEIIEANKIRFVELVCQKYSLIYPMFEFTVSKSLDTYGAFIRSPSTKEVILTSPRDKDIDKIRFWLNGVADMLDLAAKQKAT
jgi:hypothetical protein